MQVITQKLPSRLIFIVLLAWSAAVFSPLFFASSASAAATATWNNKNGSISYNGKSYVQHPVQLGISTGGGTTFETRSEVRNVGAKGFAPPDCPTTMITVSGDLQTANTATYYRGSSASLYGCEFSKGSTIRFTNKNTYKNPTAGTSLLDNGLDSNNDPKNLDTCEAVDGYSADPALCGDDCKNANDCSLTTKYINPIINKFLAPLAVLAVIIGVIVGAIQYITSAGDAQKVAQGKSKIEKALIGFLGFIFLYALLNWLIPGGLL